LQTELAAGMQRTVLIDGKGAARLGSAVAAVLALQCAFHRGCPSQGGLRNTPLT